MRFITDYMACVVSAEGLAVPAPVGRWLVVISNIDAIGLDVGGQADTFG